MLVQGQMCSSYPYNIYQSLIYKSVISVHVTVEKLCMWFVVTWFCSNLLNNHMFVCLFSESEQDNHLMMELKNKFHPKMTGRYQTWWLVSISKIHILIKSMVKAISIKTRTIDLGNKICLSFTIIPFTHFLPGSVGYVCCRIQDAMVI